MIKDVSGEIGSAALAAEVERTREFIPNENETFLQDVDIDARLDELSKQRESFDPITQPVGLRQLPERYTAAEAYAFLLGPTKEQLRLNKHLSAGICAAVTGISVGATMWKTRNMKILQCLFSGFAIGGPVGWVCGSWAWDKKLYFAKKRDFAHFHYALIHEKDLPIYERKKIGDCIKDWHPRRSLNVFGGDVKW